MSLVCAERGRPADADHIIDRGHRARQHLRLGAVLPLHFRSSVVIRAQPAAAGLPGLLIQPALQREFVHRAPQLHLRELCQPHTDLPEHCYGPSHPVMTCARKECDGACLIGRK